jgi:hypothetical protein
MEAADKLESEFSGVKVERLDAERQRQASEIVAESKRIRDSLATLEARCSPRSASRWRALR